MSSVKQESALILMNLIYMEIAHNSDDSARDLSSLGKAYRTAEQNRDFFFLVVAVSVKDEHCSVFVDSP